MKSLFMIMLPTFILAVVVLTLSGCAGKVRDNYIFVDVPELSPATVTKCPAPPLVTGDLGDLAMKDKDLAVAYGRCSARGDTAVDAYETVRQRTAEAKAKAAAIKP